MSDQEGVIVVHQIGWDPANPDEVLPWATISWPEPWTVEDDIKGDGHWDNQFHVLADDGGVHLATFEFRSHAELFALAPQIARERAEAIARAERAEARVTQLEEALRNLLGHAEATVKTGTYPSWLLVAADRARAVLDQ